jgi:hypothetical protein
MNKVTSIALLNTNGMQRISITYSVINDEGVITEDNKRINRVVVDSNKQEIINQLYDFAQTIVDAE